MSRPSPSPDRKPRADVERNRARLLAAARALFAEQGTDVQVPELARAAGVGIGTVYRHFPTRQALVEAAAEDRFAEIEQYARTECLQHLDPGDALAGYLRHVGEVLAGDRGLSAAIEAARASAGSEPRGETRTRLESVIADIIKRAQGAGAVRPDCTVADVYMLVGALAAVIRTDSGDWRRFLALVLDGLRPL